MLVLKVLPSDVNVNIKELKLKIEKKLSSATIREESIALGLVTLILNVLIEDKEGELEKQKKV